MTRHMQRRLRPYRSLIAVAALGGAAYAVGALGGANARAAAHNAGDAAPAFTHTGAEEWLNSPPLQLATLTGRVVLLDVWTTDCWNCYHSFPWLHELERRYGAQGVRLIGVLSPEFEREKDPARIRARLAQYQIEQPVMLDSDYSYWNALGNHYWPAFYLIDKHGRIRARLVGEQHTGDASASAFERQLQALIAE